MLNARGLWQLFLFLSAVSPLTSFPGQMSLAERITGALEIHQQGDITGALRRYLEIIPSLENGPLRAKLHSNAGAVYMQLGSYETARDHFLQAAEMNPDDASAAMNLAIVLTSKLDDHSTALRYALKAVRASPESPKLHHLVGNILQNMGRGTEAEQYFILAEKLAVDEVTDKPADSRPPLLPHFSAVRVSDELKAEADGRLISMVCVSRRPLVFIARGVLSAEECEQVVRRAAPLLEKSFVMGGGVSVTGDVSEDTAYSSGSHHRDSFNAWLASDPLLESLQRRVAELTRIPAAYIRLKAEELQVVKYNASGYFNLHHDSSMFHPRLLTALVYLNSLFESDGGETWFPFANTDDTFASVDDAIAKAAGLDPRHSGLGIRPAMGDAVIFFNHDVEGGALDASAVHAGLRVASETEKWIANYWIELDEALLGKLSSNS